MPVGANALCQFYANDGPRFFDFMHAVVHSNPLTGAFKDRLSASIESARVATGFEPRVAL